MGPLIIDFQSTTPTQQELEYLEHPLVGGVILFARNYTDSMQLMALTHSIKHHRPDCLICVDHEGGRVQRFRHDGFTQLPAMGSLKDIEMAFACGVVMGYELKQHGIHVNFAPVLDRDNVSNVIGDRGFSEDPNTITKFASALLDGMASMNMPGCGKHFPGHGSVVADSHIDCPVDTRGQEAIAIDMVPFEQLINKNAICGIMPAHVVYEQIDSQPAGYSNYWLNTVLKQQLNYSGVIFSDDLSMEGASLAGDYGQRAESAYNAGCDFLLLCNAPQHIAPVLSHLENLTLRKTPDCSQWFRALPPGANASYEASLNKLKGNIK